jgi:hypothetical protein
MTLIGKTKTFETQRNGGSGGKSRWANNAQLRFLIMAILAVMAILAISSDQRSSAQSAASLAFLLASSASSVPLRFTGFGSF